MTSTEQAQELTRAILYAINIIDVELLSNPEIDLTSPAGDILVKLQERLQKAFRKYGHEV